MIYFIDSYYCMEGECIIEIEKNNFLSRYLPLWHHKVHKASIRPCLYIMCGGVYNIRERTFLLLGGGGWKFVGAMENKLAVK